MVRHRNPWAGAGRPSASDAPSAPLDVSAVEGAAGEQEEGEGAGDDGGE